MFDVDHVAASGLRAEGRGVRGRVPRTLAVLAVVVLAVGTAGPVALGAESAIERTADPGTASAASVPRSPSRIVVIVMENHEYPSIIGSSSAPYINSLASRFVLLSHAYAITHPSLPNYLALTSGSTHGVTSDCTTCYQKGRSLIDQLASNGVSWKAYMQTMPNRCFKGASAGSSPNLYVKKHNPFIYYDHVRNRSARCNKIVPFGRFPRDLSGGLPRFVWITPNECKDMHSCSVSTGDRFLKRWVPKILPKLRPSGILILAFDEGTSDLGCCGSTIAGGHIAAIIAGPGAKRGAVLNRSVDHYSILRLIERAWRFPRLRHAGDARTPTIHGWKR